MPAWNATQARAHGHSTSHGHDPRTHSAVRARSMTREAASP